MKSPVWIIAVLIFLGISIAVFLCYLLVGVTPSKTVFVICLAAGFTAATIYSVISVFSRGGYNAVEIAYPAGDVLVKESGANHLKGIAVAGKLALTNKRLIFKSSDRSAKVYQHSIDLKQIESARLNRSALFFRTTLLLRLNNADQHKFVVEHPQQWLREIELVK